MDAKFMYYQQIFIAYALKIIYGIIIILVGKYLSKRIGKLTSKALEKTNTDKLLVDFLGDLTYYFLFIISIVIALSTIGIKTTSLAAVIGAATLAIGLALQGNLSNLGSGVVILLTKPFKDGDFVEIGGITGIVEKITIFNTLMKTPDNRSIIMPNSKVIGTEIINYSVKDIRRVDLLIGVGYDSDLKKVRSVLEEILESDERILKEPPYFIAVMELADSSINFAVRPWVKAEDYWAVRCDLLERIKERFDAEGIEIPYPKLDVNLSNK